jgi:hypothetical protein
VRLPTFSAINNLEAAGVEPASIHALNKINSTTYIKPLLPVSAIEPAVESKKQNIASIEVDLQKIINAWDILPDALRQAILNNGGIRWKEIKRGNSY